MTTLTVKIWHNVRTDDEGRHPAFADGYTPGDPLVCVFAYQTAPRGRSLQQIADHAFAVFNGHPFDDEGERLAGQYYGRRLRSVSAGDVVSMGEAALAAGRPAGWVPVPGSLHEVRTDEHGTHPLPGPGGLPGTGTPAAQAPGDLSRRGAGRVSGLMVAVAASRGRYGTRTRGGAYLYRVTQFYDSWPFGNDSRVPAGSSSRRRTETFRTLEPARQRLARANLHARHQRRNGGDWSDFIAVAEQLTDDGWQPLDLDFPPPCPARGGQPGRTRHSRRGAAPAGAGPGSGEGTPR